MSREALQSLSDKDLVRRSADGDEVAFEVLFERKHRRVYLVALQIVGDPGAAEEVAQEAFVALWRNAHRYRARYAVDTWLLRIATNRAIDRYRSDKRHPKPVAPRQESLSAGGHTVGLEATVEAAGERADPTHRVQWREAQELWDRVSGGLTAQQRAAFVLREIEGLPSRAVARAMGCSTSTVRSHLSLARKTLRATIAAEREAPDAN